MNDFDSVEIKRMKSAVESTGTAQRNQKKSTVAITVIMTQTATMMIGMMIIVFSLCSCCYAGVPAKCFSTSFSPHFSYETTSVATMPRKSLTSLPHLMRLWLLG
jgi:hypothetical protein